MRNKDKLKQYCPPTPPPPLLPMLSFTPSAIRCLVMPEFAHLHYSSYMFALGTKFPSYPDCPYIIREEKLGRGRGPFSPRPPA